MSTNREIAEQYLRLIDRGQVDAAVALFAPAFEFTNPMARVTDVGTLAMMMKGYGASFPGHQAEITNAVEAGEHVVVEGIWRGTHTGPMMLPNGASIPATGKTVAVPFATLFRIQGGKIQSHHGYWDAAGFMAQLGLGGS